MTHARTQLTVTSVLRQRSTRQNEMSQKGKGRKFFQQMQPTFSIELPKTTPIQLEFLDHSDPAKDAVVRKKAREWVNRNKEMYMQSRGRQLHSKRRKIVWVTDDADNQEKQLVKGESQEPLEVLDPLRAVGTNYLDPFNLLPNVGRKYDHIIQFFLTTCPEEVPCSDDKYSDKSKHPLVPFYTDNTVLGNMRTSDVAFILWLYATVSIRGVMLGRSHTEEVQWFYNKALKAIQETLKEAAHGIYSEHLLKSLACITATASFSGMFKTAETHRDALIRVLELRGGGDILLGLQSASPWTIKAIKWCEIMVATQLSELPRIPYFSQTSSADRPQEVVAEAARLTANSLSKLPTLSEPLHKTIHLLHLLGFAYAQPPTGIKIDAYIIQPMYDIKYALLQILVAQKEPDHGFSEVEVLLVEAFQLFFWTGPRMLPPQTRLCDLLISRTMNALLPLLLEIVPDANLGDNPATTASLFTETNPTQPNMAQWVPRSFHHPTCTNNAIAWSLALGTMVSATMNRPEHLWFKEHLRLQLQVMGLDKSEQDYRELLRIFPTTDGFAWIDLRTLYCQFGD